VKVEDEDLEAYKKRKIAQVESLGRAGGVYIPPFKLARLQQDIEDKTCPEYQRQAWEALRKSINGLVNKVNTSNIKNLVEELFQENLVRGQGLFCRSVVRAQMASPGFTHVFAALAAVVNSKLPQIGDLLIRRIILQFRRAYKRNDKIVTTAVIKFMAHLVNQKVVSELLALHVATLLLERVTDDSIEVCVSFMQECGQALGELSPAGCHAIFERFRTILHEGEIDRRVQYVIEGLFEVRRKKFADYPMQVEELDLVDEEDQITHEVDLLDETIKGEETLNIFKAMPPQEYAVDEAKWKQIGNEILGLDEAEGGSSSSEDSEDDEQEAAADKQATQTILDFTEQDLVNLRRSIYLVIMSSAHFEECVHKILKLNISEGQEKEVCTMLIDCCAMDRMFNRFFCLQAERLSRLNPVYQDNFHELFSTQFNTVHRLETNKLRNIGKFFAHLLYTDAISWSIFTQVRITEETTTSSSRIFIKVIFQELSEQWGIKKLAARLKEEEQQQFFGGLFPKDHPKNVRFAINYFTAIGLGVLTEDLRKFLEKEGARASEQAKQAAQDMADEISTTSSDSDSSDSDSSSS
jgi:pre-mRNA-splicing factor CWC22